MKYLAIFRKRGKMRHCMCGNFGDNLTSFILQKVTPYATVYKRIHKSNIVGIGSILSDVPEDYNGYIWTSGFASANDYKKFTKANVIAVRGQLTLNRTECDNKESVILGDGGLLCHLFADPMEPKQYELGVIPHYIDKNVGIINKLSGGNQEVKVLDVCDTCENVIREANKCKYIISSSLHGLILADSLKIPNMWIKLSDRLGGNGFKFKDYYSVFGIEDPEPWTLNANEDFANVMDRLRSQKYERMGLDSIKTKLSYSIDVIKSMKRHHGFETVKK